MSPDDKKTKKQLIDETTQLRRLLSDVSDLNDTSTAIKCREKQLSRAEEIAQIGTFVVDVSSGEMKWSHQVYRMLGLEPGGIKPDNETFWEFVHIEDRERLIEAANRVFAGEVDLDIQYRIVRNDGELRNVHTHADREFDEQGNLVYIWGFSQDISDRKQDQDNLSESQELIEAQFSHSPAITLIVDREHKILRINRPMAELYSAEELIGKDAVNLLPPEHRDAAREALNRCYNTCELQDIEHKISGGRWVRGHIAPILKEGKATKAIIMSIDITEHKLAEEALRTEKEFTETALNSQQDTFFLFEAATGKAVRWNQVFNDITGYSDEEIAKMEAPTSYYSPDDLKRANIFIQEVLKTGLGTIELELICKNGDRVSTEYRVSVIKGEDDLPKYIVSIGRDITEQKLAEEELRDSREVLRAILNSIPTRVFWKDKNLRYLGCNTAFARDAGFEKPEDILGKDDFAMGWREQAELYRADDRMVIESGNDKLYIEESLTTPSGEKIQVLTSKVPLQDADGTITGVLGTYQDITGLKKAEEELLESKETAENYLNVAAEIIVSLDTKGKITMLNESGHEILGYEKGYLVGKNWFKTCLPERMREDVGIVFDKLMRGDIEEIKSYENPVVTKDGVERIIFWHNTILREKTGEIYGLLSSGEDITERKQAEEHIRNTERKSLAWLENSPVCTKVVDLDFNLQFMSTAGIESLKIADITQLYGQPYPFSFYPDSFRKLMSQNLKKAKETGQTITQEASVVDLEGNELWYHSTIVPVNDDNDQLEYIMILSIETTKRRQFEMALRESENRFRNLAEASHEGVAITTAGLIVEVNKQLAEMLGYRMDKLIGLPVKDLVAPESHAVVAHHVSTNSQEAYEYKALRKDGTIFLAEARGRSTRYRGKEVRVTAIRDITETKRLQELESRAERLETAGTIAGQVAHDFNNLLAPIMTYPEFIREELPENHSVMKYIDQIEEASRKIADINQDLLTMGRRGHYSQCTLSLNEVVRHALKESKLIPATMTCETDLADDIMNINGGAGQLHRVISNLLYNAKDAIRDIGKITVKTENFYADDVSVNFDLIPKGEYVKLTISDTGCGISEDVVQKIFDPFFSTKAADKMRGSGLGMSVVDAVIKDHNGFIDLTTKVGEGTSFYVYFPVTRESIDTEDIKSVVGGNEAILIVDDDEIQREVTSTILSKLGYDVSSVKSGEKAVEFLHEKMPDLILLDMIMPAGIDGEETYRQILQINPHQKAIILSGFSESDKVLKIQKLGAGGFVKKPITRQVIAIAVRKEIERVSKVLDGNL